MDRRKSINKGIRRIRYIFPYLRHLNDYLIYKRILRKDVDSYAHQIGKNIDLARKPIEAPLQKNTPTGFLIEITNNCNLNCLMCNTHASKRPKKNMSLNVFNTLLMRLSEENVKRIGLHTVGEPFCYPQLDKIITMARKYQIDVSLSTNANFPDKVKKIYESNPFWINSYRFSVDGADKEIYEKIRAGGTFEKVIESCENVNMINRGKFNSRIALSFDCTINEYNIKTIPSFFRFFSKYTFHKNLRFSLINSLSPDTSFFDNNKLDFPNLYAWNVPCSMVFNGIYFNNEGMATLCCRDYDNQLIVGDTKSSTIKELWNSEEANRIRSQHLGKLDLEIEQCQNCYGPKPGVAQALNNYIHFLWAFHREQDDAFFEERVLDFLSGLNTLLAGNGSGTVIEDFLSRQLKI